MNRCEGKMKTPSLRSILCDDRIMIELCQFLPSIGIRLRRISQAYFDLFPDQRLAELLPATFEKLGLFYGNPFQYCQKGDVESVWLMLVHGVDPFITGQNGETLLQVAVQSGSVPLVHMLIERGCSASGKGAFGYSALHQLAYTPFASLCEFILSNGGNLDSLSKNGSTPLLIASREGHAAVVECMLRHGADPNDGGDKGLTPLLLAASEGHLEVVKLLLSFKADGNLSLCQGRTPLHESAESGHTEVCRALIEFGNACVHCQDFEGLTPIDIARQSENLELVEVLTSTEFQRYEVRDPDRTIKNNVRHERLPPNMAFAN